ncbi:MAG TPA: hypothetical protein VI913_04600 [Candidatus Peribacteraceae bacterium]|nr:MAG: hypothetical protein A3J67_03620 [Parcubacteria group bacterium RIFCSPHIGHO2_02_FULL_48_10b]HLD64143.1 hypothetical protein [Candidatus Peribacteraceae bacterium]
MQTKLQQIAVKGENLLKFIDAIPIKRWTPEQAGRLSEVVAAIGEGLQRFHRKTTRRSKEKEK